MTNKTAEIFWSNYIAKYCPEVELLEKCNDVKSGLSAIKTHQPDIVFLDIEMPYGNGFDLLDQVDEVNFETIFVTAYNNYAVQALNRSAAYYLLKPIDIDELIGAVEKNNRRKKKKTITPSTQRCYWKTSKLNQMESLLQKIMLPTLEGFEIVPIADIMYCEADDNFTRFHLVSKKELLICRTLKYFEETLADQPFVRVHRSHMINLNYVIRYTKGKGGYITMENHVELEVSPKKKAIFLEAFRR